MNNKEKKILFLELGVGRMTPMFIQEPFWNLTLNLPDAYYIAVNAQYDFLPKDIEEKGMVIKGDIAKVLKDAAERDVKKWTAFLKIRFRTTGPFARCFVPQRNR